MRGSEYAELAAFVAVVNQGSFTRGEASPDRAVVAQPDVKKLEDRLGVELLHRTTRSVAMTGAGVRPFHRFRPAMAEMEMEAAVTDLHELSVAPSGLVRLHAPRPAYARLLEGRLGELHRSYPNIHLDTFVDDALIDIVRAGFDLDIRLAGAVDPSTSSVAVGGPVRHVAVASPAYLAAHGIPASPSELTRHRCIRWRRPDTEHPYRWEFQIDGCATAIEVEGPLTVSHCDIAVAAARDGVGIAFVLEEHARAALETGALKAVLSRFLPPLAGWCVCHPRTSRRSAATDAVIEFLSVAAPDKPRRVRRRG